ncbi:shikimate dehydrogenase family protein [Flavisolibacter ginsenosidimutans]|uniref:Shikimate dehydrogenase n=1 Tax=Flavisolibacter ginsenosidimutans TaxID=661481 RepID=A0A5B8UH92_9BACT|nr:shikimate dehydrogenase [Flavisolibacter ginsenosidimutans]QEC56007.1 shikimate dehydrogenase [Flavisolibacter ginsenosidimutans]
MKRYGLLGRTLTHSFSKSYFAKKFAEEGISDAVYENFELKTVEEFPLLLSERPDLKGLNVTIPYKEEVLQFLTDKNDVVEAIGACNTIKIEGENLTGYNTDVIGFRKSLEPQLRPHHKKALVLGTGGASKAIWYVLNELGIEPQLVSRHKQEGQCGYEDLGEEVLSTHHLIINTTPLGMYPNINADPPIPYEFITPQHFLFDLIYNPPKTKFLAEGEKRGAQICNGQQMLIEQAEASWRIWTV